MKLKESYFYTLREDVKDEESVSGNLLVRSGMVKKIGTGIYSYMPLGMRTLHKIEAIVREEMDRAGAQELLMPSLLPEDVYVASGRRDVFGHDMFSLKDRFNRNYVLGPTHEELFVQAAKEKIKSYKDMPFNLYQMANKYRDEPRPRYGLIRVREFIMKDAYSFDADLKGLDESYQKMYHAYQNIFNRLGIDYRIVTADTGAMGGLLSEEFQAITDIGEDTLVICPNCDYASNIEVSQCVEIKEVEEEFETIEKIHTPNHGTVEELVNVLHIPIDRIVKTLIYLVDEKPYAFLIPGNREINETKISKLLHAKEIELASPEVVAEVTHANIGFAGPIGLEIPIIIDQDVLKMKNFLVGANETDYHYIHVNVKDFHYEKVGDIKNVKEGDVCPKCGDTLIFKKGIEVGNTFKLGTKYSESLGLYYTDSNNEEKPVQMGCYGIGIGRILAALVEQNHDEKGMKLPFSVAPYSVGIVLISSQDEEQTRVANELYDLLLQNHIDVILDDRDIRPGVKFNDFDLIGIPLRLTVGKKAKDGIIEWHMRDSDDVEEICMKDVLDKIKEILSIEN